MKKIIAAALLSACLSSVALAGDIPGSGPAPPPPTLIQQVLKLLGLG